MSPGSLLPLFAYFLVGIALRVTGVVRGDQADVLLRIVFHVTLPSLAFLVLSGAVLDRDAIWLPVIGFAVNLTCLAAALIHCRLSAVTGRDAGTAILAASAANMVFMFPFVLAALGLDALAQAMLFDVGNAMFVAVVANSVAIHFGSSKLLSVRSAIVRLIRTPLFVALLLAIILNIGGYRVPQLALDVLTPLGVATVPMTICALGIAFRPGGLLHRTTLRMTALRMLTGLAAGSVAVLALDMADLPARVIVVSAAAPIGFSALALGAVARLDTGQIAAAVSLSVFVGMLSTPALLWIVQQ